MPRIDPARLLKTLGVLLAPDGGIKSTEEVITKDNLSQQNKMMDSTFEMTLKIYFPGSPIGAIDAKVFQEACFQSCLCEDP